VISSSAMGVDRLEVLLHVFPGRTLKWGDAV
jgi:hypothetical protein